MSTEINRGSDGEVSSHSTLGRGHLSKGKWYCECDRPAKCLTTKKSGPHQGRKFWTCAKVYDMQCAFFLWVDHEAAAKQWLESSKLPQAPQTPTKTGVNRDDLDSMPQILETPFAKARRKRVSRDVTNDDDDDDNNSRNANTNESPLQPVTPIDLRKPSEQTRKAARTSSVSTPGQHFIERLQGCTPSMPTPNSRDHISSSNTMASQPRLPQLDTSPTPGRFSDLAGLSHLREPDLTTTVLDLVRAEYPNLKASTEMQIRHEIGLALDVGETKLRRYEGTIAELSKRVDELETMVLNLT